MFVSEREVKLVFLDDTLKEDTATVVRPKLKYTISGKLFGRYTGPHEVYEVINPVVYVAIVDGALRTVHANKMKRDIHTEDEVVDNNRRLRVSPFYQKSMVEVLTTDAKGLAEQYVKKTLPKVKTSRLAERKAEQNLNQDMAQLSMEDNIEQVVDSSSSISSGD
jgi:hypothetical protein